MVGHEITHVLEGTELYNELQSAIVEYAKSKGDYQGRYDTLAELYKDIDGANIDAELTADLVGDYLFTDIDFIKRLSAEHRNVFQKLYDEIKYLCKVATAGSKEAKELEKVKKLFEDAYRTETKNPTADGGVKYALSDGTVKNASELSRSDLQYLLESAQNGEMSDNSYIPLRRNTPEFFIGVVEEHSNGTVVVENYPMAVTVEHIRQNMDEEDGQSYGEARPHGFSVDDIITISEKMGDPAYIVLQKNGRYAEVVSFHNKRNKQVVVAIDFADNNPAEPKNFKHSQYMNGYEGGYYNIIVTQYEPDNFAKYLNDNEVVYSKKEMNGRYQVGSGRIVTVTHDTPFIEDIISEPSTGVKKEKAPNTETSDVFGFAINKNIKVNEDLLEELSIHDPNAEVDADGNITVYHRTTAENADSIRRTGIMKAQEDALFFSSKDSGYASDYGDTVVKLKIPSTVLQVNDIFDGEVHFDIPLKYKNGGFQLDVSRYLQDIKEPSKTYSISGKEQTTASTGEYRITGEDIALTPTREDIARMEQERIATAQNAPRNDIDELGAPTHEDIARMERDAETKNTTNDRVVKNKISDLDIDRKYIDFKDTSKANEVVDAKVSDLVERGKVVPLSNKSIAKYKDGANWSKFKEVRQLLRDVLMPNRDISVVFEYGEQGAVAYLTSKGINHSVGGPASPTKAAAFEQFKSLVKNAEYVYSSNNDIHNNANKNIDGDILWDTFVAVGTINGEPYPVTFKIRSIDADIRSQIYEMATKNETGFSHEDGDQNDLTHAHSNYGTSPVSGERVTQDSGKVNGKFSISKTEDAAHLNDVEELGAPTSEDIARAEAMQAEAEKELHGPWRMTDPLDQKVEKLFRMMLREEVSEQDYMAQLVKADRQYQQRGSRVEEALERVREAYSKEATATPEIEKKVERLTRKVLHEGIMGRMKDALAEKTPRFDVNRGVCFFVNPNHAQCFPVGAGCGKFHG